MTTNRENSSERDVAPEDPSVADAAEEYQIVHPTSPEAATGTVADDDGEEQPTDSPLE